MDQVVLAYHQDVAARKKNVSSAHHKKNGKATVKLGNKPVTNKEINKKHGPIFKYPSPDGLMEFAQFMALPDDLATEFIIGCCDKYDIRIDNIGTELFNLDQGEMKRVLSRRNIYKDCHPDINRGKGKITEFRADIATWRLKVIRNEEKKNKCLAPLGQFINLDRLNLHLFDKSDL